MNYGRITKHILVASIAAFSVPGMATNAANVTVPFTLDDNRVTINARISGSAGQADSVRAWVDTGNPDLWITADLADRLRLKHLGNKRPSPFGNAYLVQLPHAFDIAGYHLIVPKTVRGIAIEASTIGPGLNAVVNIPATVLSQADVEFDYPDKRLVLSSPGSGHLTGIKVAVQFDPQTSLIRLPVTIDGTRYLIGLDTGATYSFIDKGLLARLMRIHPDWRHMTGALGEINIWGLPDEPQMRVLRIPRLKWGPLKLNEVGIADNVGPPDPELTLNSVVGVMGGNVLTGFRIDIDYVNREVYFDKASYTDKHHFDMVGLMLRPRSDGSYTVLKIAEYHGKPSVPSIMPNDRLVAVDGMPITKTTMGQVILALSGTPGQSKRLDLERDGRMYSINAIVRRFLAGD